MGSQYGPAIDMFVDRSRVFINNNDHQGIVIHKTAGFTTVQELYNYFSTTPLETSSHFGIGLDGTVAQFVRLEDGAAANCCVEVDHASFVPDTWGNGDNGNVHTISIEHIDPTQDNSTEPTPEQMGASIALVKWLCETYSIPKQYGYPGIMGHVDIDPHSRARCPGTYNMNALYQGIQSMQTYSENSKDFSRWFTVQPDGTWKCKQTGNIIKAGFKDLFSQLSIDGNTLPVAGLPKTNEIPWTRNGKSGTYQIYERMSFIYDANAAIGAQPGFQSCYIAPQDHPFLAPLDPYYVKEVQTKIQAPAALVSDINKLIADEQSVTADIQKAQQDEVVIVAGPTTVN